MDHNLVIDLESWTYPDIEPFKKMKTDERKKLDAGYIVDSTLQILDILDDYNIKTTFFIITELYDWYPDLIDDIYNSGHEVAHHTHKHNLINNGQSLKKEFESSEEFIKKFKPEGFQAPQIIFPRDGYKILREFGFKYSSSIYYPDSTVFNFNGIKEIPIKSIKFRRGAQQLWFPRSMNRKLIKNEIPIGSSYFMALLGDKLYNEILKRINCSWSLFIHNWQIVKPEKAIFPNRQFLFTHPYYLPYTWDIRNTFESILKNYKIKPMNENEVFK